MHLNARLQTDIMMKEPVRKKRVIFLMLIIVLILLSGYFLIRPAIKYFSGYLSKSEQVQADVLIVEGWLSDSSLVMASEEFRKNKYKFIITTGLDTYYPYYNEYGNGYLTFYTKNKFSGMDESIPHSIEVDAYSSLEGENCAHFNLFINDSLASEFLADKQKRRYCIKWNGDLSKIDSIRIQFTNDGMGDYGDRNLYIKEIIIDHKLTIPYLNNSVYYLSKFYGRNKIINNTISSAVLAKKRLIMLGIDSTLITAVRSKKVRINRTLTSALAFRDWLKTEHIEIRGINIISVGTHARRTWMTYNKILNEKYKIGIISLPENRIGNSPERKMIQTIRELFGIVYYWIILIPY
jgi:hypothetical protein